MTSDTPRTDAVIVEHWEEANYAWGEQHKCVNADFARQLERDLAAAIEGIAHLHEELRNKTGATVDISGTRYECNPAVAAELAATNAEREELRMALEMMWDQYENGTQCYEEPDEHAGYLGHAVKLSADEEQRVLALIPAQCSAAIDAAIAAREP